MAHLSVIIPVYKAENCLNELYNRLTTSLESITKDYEIILVEDCGGDRSWEIINNLAQKDSRVKGIKFSRNFGQHYGITAGLHHCTGDYAIIMDCDLQDQPEEIPNLYYKIQEGYDVVLAKRHKRKDSVIKRLFSRIFYRIFNYFLDLEYNGQVGNFRIISKKVIDNYKLFEEKLRFFGGMITWMGFNTAVIEVEHAERFAGKSSYNFRKLWNLAIDTIIAFSDKPLRLVISFGFIISAISFFYGAYIIAMALFDHTSVEGWSSLIVSIYFIGGIIIAILGIIGIYLGKTFDETKKRPLYIIDTYTDGYQS